MVVFNHKQVIIGSFKHCGLTVAIDISEDMLKSVLSEINHLQGPFFIVSYPLLKLEAQTTLCSMPRLAKGVILFFKRARIPLTSEGLTQCICLKKTTYI